jgi:predicted ATPase/class 3 adenylate cyclase
MGATQGELPTGTITFLFSDIEGSTELVQRAGPDAYRQLLEQHQRLLRAAFATHAGIERGTEGDSFLVIFRDAPSALAAAVDAQRALAETPWPAGREIRVRIGLHSGEGIRGGDDYVGIDIDRAARIAGAAHGGQVLISDATRALAERSLPAGVQLRDVGRHRLKGLELPEHLHQVTIEGLRADFPPVRSMSSSRLVGAPARTSSFLGRIREVEELTGLLRENRLVTLVGTGGTGKTSLAIEIAAGVADQFAEGAVFVPLEAIADPDRVGSAIVAGLGLRDTTGRPARDQLLDNLSGRELLLVLDNFEHLVDAAPLVAELLGAGPALKVLTTSRAALHLPGEQTYPVLPLPVPETADALDPIRLGSVESVRLFVDRARRVLPDFQLGALNAGAVADICRLLDGLPLGIEIAAARVRVLGPAGIRDRLAHSMSLPGSSVRGGPSRQRTLRDTVGWSHDLLDDPGRRLLRQLSVFAGGCRLEELEDVCRPFSEGDVLEALASLVDQSLVNARQVGGSVRYELLQTIREFARERLAEDADRDDVERVHASTFVGFAEATGRKLEGRGQRAAFEQMAMERDNLRAAMRWSTEHALPEVSLRLVAALARFWWLAGDLDEGRVTVGGAFAIPGADAPTTWRMRALEGAGLIHYYTGENDEATAAYRAQLELARQLGDRQGETDARFNLIFTQDYREPAAKGMALIEEIAESYRALGDERSVARTMWVRAGLMFNAGQVVEARRLLEDTVLRYRALDDIPYEMLATNMLAVGGLMYGDRQAAARWFPASLVVAHEVGDLAAIIIGLPTFAAAALEFVSPSAAATLLGAYDGMSRRLGTQMPANLENVIAALAPRERARAALDPGAFAAAIEAGAAMSFDDVLAYLDATVGHISVPANAPE